MRNEDREREISPDRRLGGLLKLLFSYFVHLLAVDVDFAWLLVAVAILIIIIY